MNLLDIFPLKALNSDELFSLLPFFVLSFGAVISLLVGTHKSRGHTFAFLAALASLLYSMIEGAAKLFAADINFLHGTLEMTSYSRYLNLMIMLISMISIVVTYGQDKKEGLLPEIYALILFATTGMMLMVSTSHLLFMFIALEIMSLPIYVLVAMRRTSRFSSEAGLKYFILGGLSSAFLLYGGALIFGATGSFDLYTISSRVVETQPSLIYYIGLGLITVAMLFKVGAFPFHGWLPDVYQGAATNITGFMSAGVKFTAFMAFAKITQHLVFNETVDGLHWFHSFIWFIAAASMIYGNFVAISQTGLKRMLSYSTIAHTGYLLLGLMVLRRGVEDSRALILYLFFYALANLGAFAVISVFEEKNQKDLTLDQIAGIGSKHPILSGVFTIFLLSMAGIPLTSGFIGKYGLFSTAVNAGEIPLVVIAVLTSVVSVYYYLRVIVYLFMKEPTAEIATYQRLKGPTIAAIISAIATLEFGLFPKAIISFVRMFAR
jgi:NADH-quinone oxidoreductase subunit N